MQRTARPVAADADIFARVSALAFLPVLAADNFARVSSDTSCPIFAAISKIVAVRILRLQLGNPIHLPIIELRNRKTYFNDLDGKTFDPMFADRAIDVRSLSTIALMFVEPFLQRSARLSDIPLAVEPIRQQINHHYTFSFPILVAIAVPFVLTVIAGKRKGIDSTNPNGVNFKFNSGIDGGTHLGGGVDDICCGESVQRRSARTLGV